MNLYFISQQDNCGYDTYDSAVVAAPSKEVAKTLHPRNGAVITKSQWEEHWGEWANSVDGVKTEYIGKAKAGTKQGLVLASFNAG